MVWTGADGSGFSVKSWSNRDLERALLVEASGANKEHECFEVYDSVSYDTVLNIKILAKKLCGVLGLNIGTDPRNKRLGSARDFEFEFTQIPKDDCFYKSRVKELEEYKRYVEDMESHHNPEAWKEVIKMEGRLYRRAKALEKLGLLQTDVDNVTPDVAAQRMNESGESSRVPIQNLVRITPAGLKFLQTGKQLRRAKRQPADVSVEEELVEIVK